MKNFIKFLLEDSNIIMYHGSANGRLENGQHTQDLRGGLSGLHLGTLDAARDALCAHIGYRADCKDWDGSTQYGKTKLAGKKTLKKIGSDTITGHNCKAPEEDYYANEHPEKVKYSNGEIYDYTNRPAIKKYEIVGKMTNTPWNAHPDWHANGYMKRALKVGNAKSGYYYKNIAEDPGSISAVVPNANHIKEIK